jgi:hypothetical protein
MSFHPDAMAAGGASIAARVFALCCGATLCVWTVQKLRKRTLLISICSLFVAIGSGLMAFAVFPGVFNRVSYALGVKYPPLLYLILAILSLLVVILHLAVRLSLVDERCRRLAQEIALTKAEENYLTRKVH